MMEIMKAAHREFQQEFCMLHTNLVYTTATMHEPSKTLNGCLECSVCILEHLANIHINDVIDCGQLYSFKKCAFVRQRVFIAN